MIVPTTDATAFGKCGTLAGIEVYRLVPEVLPLGSFRQPRQYECCLGFAPALRLSGIVSYLDQDR